MVASALPFMPDASTITPFGILGLVIIMAGLVGYRAGPDAAKSAGCCLEDDKAALMEDELKKNLPRRTSHAAHPGRLLRRTRE